MKGIEPNIDLHHYLRFCSHGDTRYRFESLPSLPSEQHFIDAHIPILKKLKINAIL